MSVLVIAVAVSIPAPIPMDHLNATVVKATH